MIIYTEKYCERWKSIKDIKEYIISCLDGLDYTIDYIFDFIYNLYKEKQITKLQYEELHDWVEDIID